MRIRCYLFGCRTDEAPCCSVCGADLYDRDYRGHPFIEYGKLDRPVRRFYYWTGYLKRLFRPLHCSVCGKRLPPWRAYDVCTNADCVHQWLPF